MLVRILLHNLSSSSVLLIFIQIVALFVDFMFVAISDLSILMSHFIKVYVLSFLKLSYFKDH